jgi:hypothetical protein
VVEAVRVTLVQAELEELEAAVQVQALLMWQLQVLPILVVEVGVEVNVLVLFKVVMVVLAS